MAQEIRSLEENATWIMSDLLPYKRATVLRWVYKSTQIEPSKAIRLVLLQTAIPNKKALIKRPMLLLLNLSIFDVSFLLLL